MSAANPHSGGSYTRDAKTGELTRTSHTQPHPAPHELPPAQTAEPQPAAETTAPKKGDR